MLATKFQINITWVFSMTTVLIQIISYVIPGWLILDIESDDGVRLTENYAVWYIMRCISDAYMTKDIMCKTQSYIELRRNLYLIRNIPDLETNHTLLTTHSLRFTFTTITEWEIQVTGGLIASIIATGLLFRLRKRNNTVIETSGPVFGEPNGANFAIVAALFIGSCMLFAASTVTMGRVHNTLTTIMHISRIRTGIPYGLIVAAIGSLLALCTSISMAAIFCKRGYRHSEHVLPSGQCLDQGIPMLPIQRNIIIQPGYASPLPPPYYAYQPVTENSQYSTKPPDYRAAPVDLNQSENHVLQ